MFTFSLIALALVLALIILLWIRPSKVSNRTKWRATDPDQSQINGTLDTTESNKAISSILRPGGKPKYNYEIGGDLGLYTNEDSSRQSINLDSPTDQVRAKFTPLDEPDPTQSPMAKESWAPVTVKLTGTTIPPKPVQTTQEFVPYGELPVGYGDHQIIALVRDPYWLFTYWEISSEKIQELRRNFGLRVWVDAQHVLRVYDTTDLIFNGTNANYFFDLLINPFASRWHVEVGHPNRTYCIERGLILQNGQYIPLVRSNYVTTPSDRVSNRVDEQWLLWSKYDRKLYRHLEQLPLGATSPQFAYSVSLAEELARYGFGVSSPLPHDRK
ncbi:MAG: DUF4912 domain-containing protein [Syntrophomonadaceae bacterium]|nr:DUF4912 domain-containing protein [Syntrophomonadaceae bacterium]